MRQGKKKLEVLLAGLLLTSAALCAGAQTGKTDGVESNEESASWRLRPFVLVRSSPLKTEQGGEQSYYGGAYDDGSRLRDYAKAHPGDYLLYMQGGTLYRTDAPAVLAEAERLYAPMRPLAEVQAQLAAQQRPLTEQQRELSEAMRAAGHDPATMGRIGREQGVIGRQQGAVGREQGTIGRQQGVLGRAFYRGVQRKLDSCLAEKSCPATVVS